MALGAQSMQDERQYIELRRRVTDQMVRRLHVTGNPRSRESLTAIRTYGIEEKTAAEVADRLVIAGELDRAESEAGAYYTLTAVGRAVANQRHRATSAA